MPELPEVETIRRDLDKDVGGRKVRDVAAPGPMALFDGFSTRKSVGAKLVGRKVLGVARRGLILILDIGDDEVMTLNLGTGARIRRNANKDAIEPDTVLVIGFTQGGQLRLIAPEGSGAKMAVVAVDDLDDVVVMAQGFDPIDEPIPWTVFGQRLRARVDQRLRTLLMDQSFVIGLGPVYADEILHSALLRYDRRADSVTIQEIRRLYRAIVETMHNAVKHRGTTLADGVFVDVFGNTGGYTEYLEVYERAGQRSRNGRGEVQKIRTSGQVHFYCDYQV
jgi:formamidopyrimidine-DNA glycosylase